MNGWVLAAVVLAATKGPVVFGDARQWFILSREGKLLERVTEIGGTRVDDLAVSPDGASRAYVPSGRRELRLWRKDWAAPVSVPNDADVVASPVFSDDGRQVYFTQNSLRPHNVGAPMRYAQVWRVPATGGAATQLTHALGCHLFPTVSAGDSVVFTHATCKGGRGVGILRAGSTLEELLVSQKAENGQALLDARGLRLVFLRAIPGDNVLFEVELATRRERRIQSLGPDATTPRMAWAADGVSVLYQKRDAVWRVSPDGAQSLVLTMEGPR